MLDEDPLPQTDSACQVLPVKLRNINKCPDKHVTLNAIFSQCTLWNDAYIYAFIEFWKFCNVSDWGKLSKQEYNDEHYYSRFNRILQIKHACLPFSILD